MHYPCTIFSTSSRSRAPLRFESIRVYLLCLAFLSCPYTLDELAFLMIMYDVLPLTMCHKLEYYEQHNQLVRFCAIQLPSMYFHCCNVCCTIICMQMIYNSHHPEFNLYWSQQSILYLSNNIRLVLVQQKSFHMLQVILHPSQAPESITETIHCSTQMSPCAVSNFVFKKKGS